MTASTRTLLALVYIPLLLAGCDLPFLVDEQAAYEAKREAEGKAVGGACRHSGRALEECYERSPKVSKAAIFAGWRDMDGYMRDNNIQVVLPDAPEPAVKEAEKVEEKPKAAEAPAAVIDKPPKAAAAAEKKPTQAVTEAPIKQNQVGPLRKAPKTMA